MAPVVYDGGDNLLLYSQDLMEPLGRVLCVVEMQTGLQQGGRAWRH